MPAEFSAAEKQAVLRKFEPELHFTRGESFYPMDIDRYIKRCSLWRQRPEEPPEELIPQGKLTLRELVKPKEDRFGTVYFLKFIDPPDLLAYARASLNRAVYSIRHRKDSNQFRPSKGRLARVGYGSRFVAALFTITLLMRGRVPGDTAAAAISEYESITETEMGYGYYGRVIEQNGWIVLQYWFFYPFNNWRSGYKGVNDHEADWEMICIYCYDDGNDPDQPVEERLTPGWVAYASHDSWGDDLRRHWLDKDVTKTKDREGNLHPIVYVGAGSHASYFIQGEYLAEVELPFLAPLIKLVDVLQYFWTKILRQAGRRNMNAGFNLFRIPFVDYARGDGLKVGPGVDSDERWRVHLVGEDSAWATNYQGLWGLYAHDPVAGENAPAGPVYNRDGSVRHSWYDPVGWVGLDRVPTPTETADRINSTIQSIETEMQALEQEINLKSAEVNSLGVEMAALIDQPQLEYVYHDIYKKSKTASAELNQMRNELIIGGARVLALRDYAADLPSHLQASMRNHIRHSEEPTSGDNRKSWLTEVFAAISIGVLMIGVVLIIQFARQYLLLGLGILIGVILFLEAGFRGQLDRLINSLTVGLAVISALVLLFQFFWQIIVVSVLLIGLYIIWENIRELAS